MEGLFLIKVVGYDRYMTYNGTLTSCVVKAYKNDYSTVSKIVDSLNQNLDSLAKYETVKY